MSVAVHVPTHLVVDDEALRERMAEVDDAFTTTVGRAVLASREVLAERVGRVTVRLEAPTYAWIGDGAGSVTDDVREDIELRLTGGLADLVEAGVLDSPWPGDGSTRDLRSASEPIDRERHAAFLHRYLLPHYDQGGQLTAVEVEATRRAARPALARKRPPIVWGVPEDGRTSLDVLEDAISRGDIALRELVDLAGVIFEASTIGYQIDIFQRRHGDLHKVRDFVVQPRRTVLTVETNDVNFAIEELALSPLSTYEFVVVADGDDASRWVGEKIRSDFYALISGERQKLLRAMDEQTLDRLAEQRIAAAIEQARQRVGGLAHLIIDGQPLPIEFPEPIPLPIDEHVPLVTWSRVAPPERFGRRAGERTGVETPPVPATVVDDRPADLAEGAEEPHSAPATDVPPAERSADVEPSCAAFEGEPPLSALGEDGELLRRLMAPIAARLQISMCDYAGGFALVAARTLGQRAHAAGAFALTQADAVLRPAPPGRGNLGFVDFEPVASGAVTVLRRLAAVAPEMRALVETIPDVYRKPQHADVAGDVIRRNWHGHFVNALHERMDYSVAIVFAMTCRILLVQLLDASSRAIKGRLDNIVVFAVLFEDAVLPRLRTIDELTRLRDRLQWAQRLRKGADILLWPFVDPSPTSPPPGSATATSTPSEAAAAQAAWERSRAEVLDALGTVPPAAAADDANAGELLAGADGRPDAIRDSKGRPWRLDDLERGIVTRRGFAEDFDPVVKQLVDLPGTIEAFQTDGVESTLRRLFEQMATADREQRRKVLDTWEYAILASSLNRTLPTQTIGSLQGIHLEAHKAIGDAFGGDRFYETGVRAALFIANGRRDIVDFVELTGVTLLSVICPPLGWIAGIAAAQRQHLRALDRQQLYQSLIDPERVLRQAEVEIELFLARLGLALSIWPGARQTIRLAAATAPPSVTPGRSRRDAGVDRVHETHE